MMRPVALIEFQGPSAKKALTPALAKPPTLRRLEATLYNDGVARYEAAAKKAARSLGGEDFQLTAQWKRTEIRRESNKKAKALMRSYEDEQKRIARDHPTNKADREKAWRKFTKAKAAEYENLAEADAQFAAQTDTLVQSGAVDVDKSKVMTWVLGGDNTCPICLAIHAGNPYTIRRATTLGAKAHPNCKDNWETDWVVDGALVKETKRKVADGEVELWSGSGRTPAKSKPSRLQKLMQPATGGWKGRRTQQRRVASSVGISRDDLRKQWSEYRRAQR